MSSADQEILGRVAAHPFLNGLSPHQYQILADCAELQEYAADQILFRAGDPARGFYLIESGRIAVENTEEGHAPVEIDVVQAGEPLGWSWMFEPFRCEYSGRAMEPTRAIFFDAIRLADHRGGDLTLGHELFKRMSNVMVRRLNAARAKLVQAAH